MKKIAISLFILGLLVLGPVIVLRSLGMAAAPATLASPPGEGRLDLPADNYTGLFRSWSLGGLETANAAQDETLIRLGVTAGSRLIDLELRRRELARQILEAETRLEQAQTAAAVETGEAPGEPAFPDDVDNTVASAGDGGFDETAGQWDADDEIDDTPVAGPSPEEAAAHESLSQLEADYAALLEKLTPAAMASEKDRLVEIALLSGGAARGVQMLLARWGQPFRLVDPGASLAGLAKTQTALIVPTGALDRKTARQLAAYTRAGGTVISFAQRNGSAITALPGRPRGFGWEETESAFDEAVEVAAAHPSTVSCGRSSFSAAVDGFFRDLPKGAEVLLRARGSGRPVAAVYPYGRGQVVATTLFTDWEALSRLPAQGETLFLRDLVLWAAGRTRRLHPAIVEPGAKIKLALPLINRSSQEMAKKVRVAYLTPEGRLCSPFDLDLRMVPGEKQDFSVTVHAPKSPGVWHLAYALVRADGSYLQYWRNGIDLAVGRPAVAPAPAGLGAAVTSVGEVLAGARGVTLTVRLWNHGSSPIEVRCSSPAGRVSTEIPGGGEKDLAFRLPAASRAAARGYYEFELVGPGGLSKLTRLLTTTPTARKGEAL